MLNIYINDSDIENQISAVTMTSERDLKCIIYININETFTVYIMKLQNLIMIVNIINIIKMMKLKL